MAMDTAAYNDLFSSLISDIKNYVGRDPLLPWLRGIRKLKESLPPQLLKEKLPRFLQKCAQAFQSDRRYANDLRFLRIWLQLMDFVDDPKAVLRTMEANRIGMKKSLFYQAYALYYEKMKNFESADKMYRMGVQNLAEPADELQKSYEQFLHRVERHKNKKIQRYSRTVNKMPRSALKFPVKYDEIKETNRDICRTVEQPNGSRIDVSSAEIQNDGINNQNKAFSQSFEHQISMKAINLRDGEVFSDSSSENGVISGLDRRNDSKVIESELNVCGKFSSDETVLDRFVDTAIVGKSDAEDARHHGLVEPTINTKEAMKAINNMFREPLEPLNAGRKGNNHSKADQPLNSGFEVFLDENLNGKAGSSHQNMGKHSALVQSSTCGTAQDSQQQFLIYVDDEEPNDETEIVDEYDELDYKAEPTRTFSKDLPPEYSEDDAMKPPQARFREDSVVYRFVGSTVSDELKVENVCHHGLVEPTINLKEAMDDINSMFGKPIEFARKSRPRKQGTAPCGKSNTSGFLILPDDSLDRQEEEDSLPNSSTHRGSELFEQTICTKEALDDINNMFKMPLDF